ncbi:MAG: DcrB-related protein [Sandaracinaceae bacterium]
MTQSTSAPPPAVNTITTSGDLAMRKPDGWLDKSMVILTGPPGEGFPPSVVVNRMALAEDQTVEEFAEAAVRSGADQFEGFELLDRDPAHVDTQVAPAFRFRWDSPRGRAMHRQVYLPGSDRTVLSVTCSTLVHAEREAWPLFETFLSSMQLGASQ